MKFKSAICFLLAAVLAAYSCSSVKYVPTETKIETVYKDSLRIKDTTVIHTETIVRDYAVAPDTLHLKGEHSYATAYLDTAQGAIKGELREKPWKEKNVYKEKIQYRDTVITKEVPVPYEVEKVLYKTPQWARWTLILSILYTALFGAILWLRMKK